MPDRATSRVVAVIALLMVLAAALRGYLPAHQRPSGEHATNPAVSLAFVVTLIGVSLTIIIVAVVTRLRDPRTVTRRTGGLPEAVGGNIGRPSWRVVLIGLAVLVVWLLTVLLLSRLVRHGFAAQVPPPGSTARAVGDQASAPSSPGQPKPSPDNSPDVLGYLGTSTVIMLVIFVVATLLASRRRQGVPTTVVVPYGGADVPAAPLASETLARAAERGLAEIEDLSREPREAIIACYAAMERELAHIPGSAPQEFDTATEVLARAVKRQALQADNAAQLVNLFAEARFSSHVMSEQHRELAVSALQLVLAELSPHRAGHVRSSA